MKSYSTGGRRRRTMKKKSRRTRRKTLRGGSYAAVFKPVGGMISFENTTGKEVIPDRPGNSDLAGGRRRRTVKRGGGSDLAMVSPRTGYTFAGNEIRPGVAQVEQLY